jgi:lipoprotein-anchoring transpeptidase ErfK/SrfK
MMILMRVFLFLSVIIVALVLAFSSNVEAKPYLLGANTKSKRIVGAEIYHQVSHGESLAEIGELYNTGVLAMIEANPGVDPYLPEDGRRLIIPDEIILPKVYPLGIIVNLAELRLYYFPKDARYVHIFPISIGRHGLPTPNLKSTISEKTAQPSWRPPEALRKRHLADTGEVLPQIIPPGPNNPLGSHALRIGNSEYLIHGTNLKNSIGVRASSGCIRMHEQDIAWLFDNINSGESVKIINQPIKMAYGYSPGERFLQAHQPLQQSKQEKVSLFPLSPAVNRFLHNQLNSELIAYLQSATGRVLNVVELVKPDS